MIAWVVTQPVSVTTTASARPSPSRTTSMRSSAVCLSGGARRIPVMCVPMESCAGVSAMSRSAPLGGPAGGSSRAGDDVAPTQGTRRIAST